MIGYLSGKILQKGEHTLIIEVNGVGYKVLVPERISTAATIESDLNLFIHTHVSERDIQLFGFNNGDEIKFFELLLSVSGIGPRSALAIMNTSHNQLAKAISEGNAVFLENVPGIGQKTAQRIIIDLRSKIERSSVDNYLLDTAISEEAIEAMIKLGYSKKEAITKLKEVDLKQPLEKIIKEALQK